MEIEDQSFSRQLEIFIEKNREMLKRLAYSNVLNDPWVRFDDKVLFLQNGKELYFEYTNVQKDLLDNVTRFERYENKYLYYAELKNDNEVTMSEFEVIKHDKF